MATSVTRRHILRLLTLAGVTTASSSLAALADETLPIDPTSAHKTPDHLSLLVGGPQNSNIGLWSTHLSQILTKQLQIPTSLPLHYTTGYDGVTAANLFDNRTAPDGNTALLTSGSALIAGISGDTRVHFDYERWIPILTSLSTSIAVARQPFHTSIPELLKNRVLKVAISTPLSKELPTLLGIELLKITAVPVFGFTDYPTSIAALRSQKVDVIQLSTPEAISDLPNLLKEGFHIFFTLDDNSNYGPSFTSLYQHLSHYRDTNYLFEAWQSIALASRVNLTMILPMLTPSPLVTKWRLNINQAIQDPELMRQATIDKMTLQSTPDCINVYNKMCPSTFAILALRRWLAAKQSSWDL